MEKKGDAGATSLLLGSVACFTFERGNSPDDFDKRRGSTHLELGAKATRTATTAFMARKADLELYGANFQGATTNRLNTSTVLVLTERCPLYSFSIKLGGKRAVNSGDP